MREASRKQRATTGFLHLVSRTRPRARLLVKNTSGTSQFCIPKNTVLVFAKNASYIDSCLPFSPCLLLRSLRKRPFSHRRMASPAERTGEERKDTDYNSEEEESQTGTPKKGRKKKENWDPGLTMGTDIEDFLQPDGKQVEIELSKVRIDQEKIKGQIRRDDPKLLLKRIDSLQARTIHVVLSEDNSMFPTHCLSFALREPSRMDLSSIHRWRLLVYIWTAQR